MSPRFVVFLLLLSYIHVYTVEALTNAREIVLFQALKEAWVGAALSNWKGSDPCGRKWEGVTCSGSRVVTIILPSMGLEGSLPEEITEFSQLETLDLSYNPGLKGQLPTTIGNLKKLTTLRLLGCSFYGPVPDSIGDLSKLVSLDLTSNRFRGNIPASIGKLSELIWLDITGNQFEGPIPVSHGDEPGLDMLVQTKHFHFGKNNLSGPIPSKLFSEKMQVIHVLFDNNNFSGSIPSTIGLLQNLQMLRLDRNALTGRVPSNLSNCTGLTNLYLSNNYLTGPIPDLNDLVSLVYLDMSNNSFDATDFPNWPASIPYLTTIIMEQTQLQGQVPVELFSILTLETVTLKNNNLNGTLDIGTSFSPLLRLVDFENNHITRFTLSPLYNTVDVILTGNEVCEGSTESYCKNSQPEPSNKTETSNCIPVVCLPGQISSPRCHCAYPYTGVISFRAIKFSDLGNSSVFELLQNELLAFYRSQQLLVDSVNFSNPRTDSSGYLELDLSAFPSGDIRFNRTEISSMAFDLSNQLFKAPKQYFGPYYFMAETYQYFSDLLPSNSSSTPIIIGSVVGGSILLLLLIFAGLYGYRQKKRAEKATELSNPFARWNSSNQNSGGIPQLKGVKSYSFEELKKCTGNFSEANAIGSGGYGKVYRGILPTGELIAIKRAQQESMQGGLEFKTEIELLSRVHHKNVVSLLGFCFEQGEQMLIYEFHPNGSLKDSLTGKTGIRLDWIKRVKVALGAARGLAYLHEHANPPIVHRDIKSTNILLDERLNAKVTDFGLSKLLGDTGKTHITTQVKGTMGYLDPEYYMTQRLTEKSDVYSFGVLMLELVTGRRPIERGKYIVRQIRMAMDTAKDLYNLQGLIHPSICSDRTLKGFDKFIDLAMNCVHESGVYRPTMGEVVKEIESILLHAGFNPNADSATTSSSYGDVSKEVTKHPYNDESFEYSGHFPPSNIAPK